MRSHEGEEEREDEDEDEVEDENEEQTRSRGRSDCLTDLLWSRNDIPNDFYHLAYADIGFFLAGFESRPGR